MRVSKPRRFVAAVFGAIATVLAIILAALSHDALVVTLWLVFGTITLTVAIRATLSLRADGRASTPSADAG